jgi:hypothetical protein
LEVKPGLRKKLRDQRSMIDTNGPNQRDAGPNLGGNLFEGLKVIQTCAFAKGR